MKESSTLLIDELEYNESLGDLAGSLQHVSSSIYFNEYNDDAPDEVELAYEESVDEQDEILDRCP